MAKKPDKPDEVQDAIDAFLDMATDAIEGEGASKGVGDESPVEPEYRRLRVVASKDRLSAQFEAVFSETTMDEVQRVLKREQIVWGIQEEAIAEALGRAARTGRRQKDVLVAKGRPAVYKRHKQMKYLFLEGLKLPDTDEDVHLASSVFRDIGEVMGRSSLQLIRGYGRPVVAVAAETVLALVQGEDEIEQGRDIYGKRVASVEDREPAPLKAGGGVDVQADGTMVAGRFGYVCVIDGHIVVVSPIWISPNHLEAYFINPPQLGPKHVPEPEEIIQMLQELGIRIGVDKEVVHQMCADLNHGELRESCVRVARGRHPRLSKGQIIFAFDPLPPAQFEGIREALRAPEIEQISDFESPVDAVSQGAVLAEQAESGDETGPGQDLYGEPIALPESTERAKLYQAGIHVRREVEGGLVRFVSEIYGYVGVIEDQILVVPPIWISQDKMAAYLALLPQREKPVLPTTSEVHGLLEQAQVRFGVDPEAIENLSKSVSNASSLVLLAKGTPPEPGAEGGIELLYKQKPDPGKLLEAGTMDFRERDGIPQVHTGDQLCAPGAAYSGPARHRCARQGRYATQAGPGSSVRRCRRGDGRERERATILRHRFRLGAGGDRHPECDEAASPRRGCGLQHRESQGRW
jgi:uncharacterized protein (DUF342 family)